MNKKAYIGIFVASLALISILTLPLSQVKAESSNSYSPSNVSSTTNPGKGHDNGNGNDNKDQGALSSSESTQPSITINPQGETKLNSVSVTAINGNILTVSIFGLNFSVDQSGAKITGIYTLPPIPVLATSTATSSTPSVQTVTISVGDKISVNGSINQSTGIIKATLIRDLSKETQSNNDIRARIQQLLQMINQLRSQLGL
jgi:hypothetical protein